MKHDSWLAKKIASGDFIVTAELLPQASTAIPEIEAAISFLGNSIAAVNVADNPHGPVLSSLAGSLVLVKAGMEPVYQIVTRDRNRIAIQSDLLGAGALGIRNVLCLSGHHQTLTGSPESANVYDIDSIQLIAAVKQMRDQGVLLDGTEIKGVFPVLIGAVANPDMNPLELNILRLAKKVEAGAEFIQTQAVFDVEAFERWIEQARNQKITENTAILAGVMPLSGYQDAETLRDHYMDLSIPDSIIERLKKAGDEGAQKKEGLNICLETIRKIKKMDGVKGIHILSGGKEKLVPEIIASLD
ncbi:MAG: methylenetetrahydrofolate reductase [Desulfobacteraceae bacterium]|nr:MAG: methylenetetrahydrofolate reductase [Desulfobacteraceae bacterium]